MDRNRTYPVVYALTAALLFGASAPLAKLLLGQVEPIPLAGLLYLGSGIALLVLRLGRGAARRPGDTEAQLKGGDYFWLAGSILAGGMIAPIVLLFGLRLTAAATASLLLNFEAVATTLIALLVFREAIGRRAWMAIALITLSGILLSIGPQGGWGFSLGVVCILMACALWGLDNNFTRNISAKDPVVIAMSKGLVAGSFSIVIALAIRNPLPPPRLALAAMILGGLCYGLSIVLFIRAMRGMGAARTSALFGIAPFAGAILSFLIFRGTPTWTFLAALPIMLTGTLILVREQHSHFHEHAEQVHEHAHTHEDEHHGHEHEDGMPDRQEHSHVHAHSALSHEHEHLPDLHHRHSH